jgi:hypothetical protein
VRPGNYTLSITAEGYHPYEQTITVGDADTQQLDIRLAPLPGTVTIATQPAGGEIILDELSLGSAPLVDLTLEAGVYRVEAVLDRYQRWQGQIDVVGRNQSQTVDVVLLPDWANVRFSATPTTVTGKHRWPARRDNCHRCGSALGRARADAQCTGLYAPDAAFEHRGGCGSGPRRGDPDPG